MSAVADDKTVGVLGGMGPEATVDFMSEVIRLTKAVRDQDHIHMIVDNNPKVPDRQAAIRGEGGDVGASLAEMAMKLEAAGADVLVMPCNTAHVFADSIKEAVSLPLIDIIAVTVAEIRMRRPDARRAGLLAASGCVDTGIYQQAMQADNIDTILPVSPEKLMNLISRIKAGNFGVAITGEMTAMASELVAAGADVIIAGCTEIPLVLNDDNVDVPLISSTEVLARKTVEFAKKN